MHVVIVLVKQRTKNRAKMTDLLEKVDSAEKLW